MNTKMNFWFQGKRYLCRGCKKNLFLPRIVRSDPPRLQVFFLSFLPVFSSAFFTLMLVLIKHVINFVPEKILKLVDKFDGRLEINVEIDRDGEASNFFIRTVPRNSFLCFDTRGQNDYGKNTCISKHFMRRFVWTSGVNC